MTKSFKVGKLSDLQDGQMKEVSIPGTDGKILLSRVQGKFYATGNACTRISPNSTDTEQRSLTFRLRGGTEERGIDR